MSVAAFEGLIRPFRDGEPLAPLRLSSAPDPAADRLHVETLTRTLHLLNAGACLPAEASIFINFDPSVFSDRAIAEWRCATCGWCCTRPASIRAASSAR